MALLPRDQILEATDLPGLADELLGPRRGRGPSATWPCPSPHHGPQTGRTPPVSIFTSERGYQRWHCHACGAGGTAIDLLLETTGVPIRQALEHLAQRTGITPEHRPLRLVRRAQPEPAPAPRPQAGVFARGALHDHVARCEATLWSPAGQPMLEYLHARGLHDDVLHANRVGADPGPHHLARARGLPARGPAVIFPVLDTHGPIYLQARYLNPDHTGGRKYDNPATWVATNPRYAQVTIPNAPPEHPRLFICEGLPDALTVAQTGGSALALLGVGLADQRLVEYIHAHHPSIPLVIAFDADPRGKASTRTLANELRRTRGPDVFELLHPAGVKDLNDWASRDPARLHELIESTVRSPCLAQNARLVPDPSTAVARLRPGH
jgi:Toprim-like